MKEKRTRYIKIRMTREEMERIKEKSASYTSVSHFIRSAVAEHSGVGAKQKLELIRELGGFYREFRNGLSHVGGNLNQSVKRANELSSAGLLPSGYVTEVLMPAILETRNTLDGIKKELDAITRKAVKL
jgi:Sec-independent protein translocase protein TatA